ncbi:hypothetical protein [Bradyrhizobium sp. DASA03120]|uniref:hypothetical protein n=1 Tax=Bradyrhizobium sp. SMVTL-02 TaxID=3395917 RepID=UPI003F7265CD
MPDAFLVTKLASISTTRPEEQNEVARTKIAIMLARDACVSSPRSSHTDRVVSALNPEKLDNDGHVVGNEA